MTAPRLALLIGPLLAMLVGCGVPTEDRAHVTAAEDVPFGLLDADREPIAGDSGAGRLPVRIYLYSDEKDALVAFERRVDEPSLRVALEVLLEGPSDAEASNDVTSALDDVDAVADVESGRGIAAVNLAPAFGDLSGADQLVALAQMVYTATARPGIGQVTFTLDGDPVDIPVGDGSLASGSVARDDYEALAPGS